MLGRPNCDEPVFMKSFAGAWLKTSVAQVRMKLTSYRRKDQVHLLDMLGIALIDATWPARYPAELATRLQHLIDTPDG